MLKAQNNTNMIYRIEYDSHGIIISKVQGELTMSIVREIAGKVLQLAKEQNCSCVLEDLREMQLKLSMAETFALPNLFAEMAAALGLQIYTFKRAVLIVKGEELLPFYETISRNRVQNVKLFYDDDSARQWLLEK